MNRFVRALQGEAIDVPPVWMMRQAGRYQRSYQQKRRRHSFEALCREPDLAASVALDAVEEFDFDAAILFSDLLFPLNALGMPLSYDDGGPKLGVRLDQALLGRLHSRTRAMESLAFQAEAVALTSHQLPPSKGLVGFIGGPWTLFVYAVEGSHHGSLVAAKTALPLYRQFARLLVPLLAACAQAQLAAGADLVMVFDTAAGELAPADFRRHVVPDLVRLSAAAPGQLGYYARGVQAAHLGGAAPEDMGDWAGFGFDWRWDLRTPLSASRRQHFVQGNFDPALLHLPGAQLRRAVEGFVAPIAALPIKRRRGWICGLGHGVLPGTPEANVRDFVRTVRRFLA
jgi:uroporphyrinogen decarboxylase